MIFNNYLDNETFNIIREKKNFPFVFDLKQLAEEFPVNSRNLKTELLRIFSNDNNFISFNVNNENFFISKKSLYVWFIGVNIRLAEIGEFKVKKDFLSKKFEDIFNCYALKTIPSEITNWANKYGLLLDEEEYFLFPLAKLISSLPKKEIEPLKKSLYLIANTDFYLKDLAILSETFLSNCFSKFSDKVRDIIIKREGFEGDKYTLQDLANNYGCTRERIRQLEIKFYKGMCLIKINMWSSFVLRFMSLRGRLIFEIDTNQSSLNKLLFFFKTLNINFFEFYGFIIIAHKEFKFKEIFEKDSFLKKYFQINDNELENRLFKDREIVLSYDDIKRIILSFKKNKLDSLNKNERIRFILKHIGRPAHYSEITNIHNEIFPNKKCTEREIHSALSEKYGIVWVGIKGTYALKELGYERPKSKIHNIVYKVTKNLCDTQKRPVSFAEIINEVKKYRQFFNENSIRMILSYNKNIRKIAKDLFVIKNNNRENIKNNKNVRKTHNLTLDTIDKKFNKFSKKKLL